MGVGAGLSMYVVVVQKFTFAISSPDEFLLRYWRYINLLITYLLKPTVNFKAPFTRYNLLSNRLSNRFDNRFYRVFKHSV